MFKKFKGIIMDANEVAAELAKHEAVCAERWKTCFNKFDDIETSVSRIETILISVSGTLIVAGAGIIWTMFAMHS